MGSGRYLASGSRIGKQDLDHSTRTVHAQDRERAVNQERDPRAGVIDKPNSLSRANALWGIGGVRPVSVRRSKLGEDHVDLRADRIASGASRLAVTRNGCECGKEGQRCAEAEASHTLIDIVRALSGA